MTLHQNLIAGEWVGSDGVENINPSNTNSEVIGAHARASADDVKTAIAAAKAAFPAWSRSGILERHAILKKTSDEIMARKEELGRLLAREEGKTLPKPSAKPSAPARSSISSPAKPCAFPARCCLQCARTSASRSPARPWASSASSRRGISRSPSPPGRSRRRSATATPSSSSLPNWFRAAPMPSSISFIARRPAEGRSEPRHGQGLGRWSGDARQSRPLRHHVYRLDWHGKTRRRRLDRT